MLTKEALDLLSKADGIRAADAAVGGQCDAVTALPNDYMVHDLERYLTTRRRARGTMSTSALAAFAQYVATHTGPGAAVFVNADTMSATAVLNLGTSEEPGHADNRAVFTAKKTAAFAGLLTVADGQARPQTKIAEFIEDWADAIKCFVEGEEVPLPKAVAAVRKITIESLRKIESEEKQLSASRSAFESVQATSTERLPTLIEFHATPYADLPPRTFALRIGILTGNDKPGITLRIVNVEKQIEQMATELTELVRNALHESGLPVMIGVYQAAG